VQYRTKVIFAMVAQFVVGLYFAIKCDYLEKEIRDLQQPTVVVSEKEDRAI